MKPYAIKGRIIDGVSDAPVEEGLVVVDQGLIAYAGGVQGYKLAEDTEVIDADGGTILPGFIDCHTHITGGGEDHLLGATHYDNILSATHQLGLLLDAGFTFIRDMSSYSGALSRAVRRGAIRGPDIMPGGRVLSPTAGHADFSADIPPEFTWQLSGSGGTCDGVEGCLKAVRLQFRDGAEFIKICTTGGVSSAVDGMDDVQFSDEEIAVMCAEAARHGTYVASHCSNTAGTYQALVNGVRSIEHGDRLDDRCIALMKERDIPVVTTLYVSYLLATVKDYPAYMIEKGSASLPLHRESLHKAHAAGVRVAFGTDFSNSKNTPLLRNGLEFWAMVDAGFTPMEAIRFGTINGAHVCKRADKIGSLERGKQADIVVVDSDPLTNIDILTHSDHVKLVVRHGKIEKKTL